MSPNARFIGMVEFAVPLNHETVGLDNGSYSRSDRGSLVSRPRARLALIYCAGPGVIAIVAAH